MLPDSTNPRVMADNIKKLDVEALKNYKEIKKIGTYSTEETDTGMLWRNNKIFRAIIDFDSEITLTATTFNTVCTYPEKIKIIKAWAYRVLTGDLHVSYPVFAYCDASKNINIYGSSGILPISYIYIEFIKYDANTLVSSTPGDDNRSIEPETEPEETGNDNER